MGANALQFVDHKAFIEDYFSDFHINIYNTEEELFQMINQHFGNNKKKVDQKLYETVRKKHTYRNRVEFMLEKI
jgi:spore maturation protein CgeB